ncbi:MAG TPA: prephenate dehydratase [Solirubrobacteraceae bacterium]|jgi:prephenate dehydratase
MSIPPEAANGRPRVGYLGPEGTFSEEALLASAAPDAVEPVAEPTIYDAVAELRRGQLEWAVVPIENSLEGSINVTLDLLAEERGGIAIVGEALLRVRHSLIAAEEVELGEILTVLTHPQVPGQCTRFLRERLPGAEVVPASSTAEAVRAVARAGDRSRAALGTTLAARIYGAHVIREGVEDDEANETRFVWLAREGDATMHAPLRATGEGEWRTSLVFWGLGAERPGSLVRCLDEFARREINLTKIESRPRRDGMGSYMFFADLAGRADDPNLSAAIAGVGAMCGEIRVLGTYRAAARAAPTGA